MKNITRFFMLAVVGLSFNVQAQFPNWTRLNYSYVNYQNIDNRSMAVNSGDTVFAYIKDRSVPVEYSLDGGNTWGELLDTDVVGRTLKLIADDHGGVYRVKFRSGAYPDTVFYSPDMGNTWDFKSVSTTNPTGPIPTYNVNGINFLHRKDNRGTIYVGEGEAGHNFKYSEDNGATWTTVICPHQPFSALVASDGTIYISTYNNGIYVSTDNGSTWDNSGYSQTTTCYDLYEDPISGDVFHAWSYMAIRKTSNQGQNWTIVASYPANVPKPIKQFLLTSDGMFYTRSDRDIYESQDGVTYNHIMEFTDNTDFVREIEASNQYLYAQADTSIYRYERLTNGGGTSNISEMKKESNIRMYPNPANDVVFLENILVGSIVNIRDISGKLVDRKVADVDRMELNTLSMREGVYFLEIENTRGIETKKLVISRQ